MRALAFKFAPAPVLQLRPYQGHCVDALWVGLVDHKSVLAEMPTGTGKTKTAAEFIRQYLQRFPEGVVYWIANTDELCLQAKADLEQITGLPVGYEKADSYSTEEPIVVCSVQSVCKPRRANQMRQPTLIVIDECHRALAPSYMKLRKYWPDAQVIGLTATPKFPKYRPVGDAFEERVFRYTVKQALDEGYWSPMRWKQKKIAALKIDELKLSVSSGDFTDAQLARAMGDNCEQILHAYAQAWFEFGEERKTIAFLPTVDLAVRYAGVLNHYRPGLACVIHGETEVGQRREIVDAFKAGLFRVFVNVSVAAEGFDDPQTSCVQICRPTISWNRYVQMVGRGTRGGPAAPVEGKPDDCLILDCTPSSAKHKLISPANIFGDGEDQDVLDMATRIAADGARPDHAVGEAKQIDAAIKAKELEVLKTARERYKIKAEFVDRGAPNPLEILHIRDPEILNDHHRLDAQRASDKVIERLKKKKIKIPEVLTAKQATKIERTHFMRQKLGLCSIGTLQLLAKFGENAINWKREHASQVVEQIKANGWRPLPKRQPGQEG